MPPDCTCWVTSFSAQKARTRRRLIWGRSLQDIILTGLIHGGPGFSLGDHCKETLCPARTNISDSLKKSRCFCRQLQCRRHFDPLGQVLYQCRELWNCYWPRCQARANPASRYFSGQKSQACGVKHSTRSLELFPPVYIHPRCSWLCCQRTSRDFPPENSNELKVINLKRHGLKLWTSGL